MLNEDFSNEIIIIISFFTIMSAILLFFIIQAHRSETMIKDNKSMKDKGAIQWLVLADSVIGKDHIIKEPPLPCQDNHYVEQIDDHWGISVVSDGLGSKPLSHIGSEFVSKKVTEYLRTYIVDNKWNKTNILPTRAEWNKVSYNVLYRTYLDLKEYALLNGFNIHDLACTVIVVVYSPIGLLVTHIGDGRAGYCTMNNEWKSAIRPINGETQSHVMPISASFWNNLESVGKYIESKVINEPIKAFTLMSDGCENFCYLTSQWDKEQGKVVEINLPYKPFFEPVIDYFIEQSKVLSKEALDKTWKSFLTDGEEKIANESDDKTLIIGILFQEDRDENQNIKT